ncbi:unnamed protein product, partial [Brassica rapa subsp. narinosa]
DNGDHHRLGRICLVSESSEETSEESSSASEVWGESNLSFGDRGGSVIFSEIERPLPWPTKRERLLSDGETELGGSGTSGLALWQCSRR